MKVALPESAPPVEPPAAVLAAVAIDAVVAIAIGAGVPLFAAGHWLAGSPWAPWAAIAFAVALVAVDVSVVRMKPVALTWRRRLGYLALVALVWRNGPFSTLPTLAAVAVVAWVGGTWIALLTGGRALSRAIAGVTGEDKPE